MKKVLLALVLLFVFGNFSFVDAKSCPSHHNHNHNYSDSHSSSQNTPVYMVRSIHDENEVKFPNCDTHYAVIETTMNYYSDGTKRVYKNGTIYNSDGSVIADNCQSIKHIIYDEAHFFLVSRNKGYEILDAEGKSITFRKYTYMEELKPNRFLVRADKKYGIVDIKEKFIVPIKYEKFEKVGYGLFKTRLNRYYGLVDIENNILVPNECEKIKPEFDTFILKRYGRYGLTDYTGKIILTPDYDKIKRLGEYIIVKNGKLYGARDLKGNEIAQMKYKDMRLKRNVLQGLNNEKVWEDLAPDELYRSIFKGLR